MIKNIEIKQVCTNALSCEPLLERAPNGELVCVVQCGGTYEPAPENRVYVFHSSDGGESWSKRESIYPEVGQAVYATELARRGDDLYAYLTLHSGRFIDWTCRVMKSSDNGYTWEDIGEPPFFPEYTFMRAQLKTNDGRILLPYQTYPVTEEEKHRLKYIEEQKNKYIGTNTKTPYCESGVLISSDGGKSFEKHSACKLPHDVRWVWSEPTVAEMSDGRIVMILRKVEGCLYRCESADGGYTWGECVMTDIPNPSNKPRLFMLDKGRIALVHTPHNDPKKVGLMKRFPLELWISDDDMKSWCYKKRLTDFPGSYSYTDGFYEDGHIHFVIEHNRHTVLYFDVELDG